MFTINLEDGREAPSKARKKGTKRLEFLVLINCNHKALCIIFGNQIKRQNKVSILVLIVNKLFLN